MDVPSVLYSETLYNKIVSMLSLYLENFGFNPAKVHFIPTASPISVNEGGNIFERCKEDGKDSMPWYEGKTLAEAMNDLDITDKSLHKPLRISIGKIYKISGK